MELNEYDHAEIQDYHKDMSEMEMVRNAAPFLLETLKRLYAVAGGFEKGDMGGALDMALHAIHCAEGKYENHQY